MLLAYDARYEQVWCCFDFLRVCVLPTCFSFFRRSRTSDVRARPSGPTWQTKTQRNGTRRGHKSLTWQPKCETRCLEWETSTRLSNAERRATRDKNQTTLSRAYRRTNRRDHSHSGTPFFMPGGARWFLSDQACRLQEGRVVLLARLMSKNV